MNRESELLSSFSQTLSTVSSESELEECVKAMLDGLSDCDTSKVDKLTLLTLANETCAAILNFYRARPVSSACRELLDLLEAEGVLASIYQTAFNTQRPLAPSPLHPASFNTFELEAALGQLIKGTKNPDYQAPKNVGLAILDLNGDFLWMDEKSESFFEVKRLKIRAFNLFDLMIPMSRQALVGKFGKALFGSQDALRPPVAFSYVVYSKHSMRRIGRLMVRNKISNSEEILDRIDHLDNKAHFYKQYLKALSSRATIINLRFTAEEYVRYWRDAPAEVFPVRPPVASTADSSHSEQDVGSNDPQLSKPKSPTPTTDTDLPQFTRSAVLLETRLSFNTPKFDYALLENDPVIRTFENKTFDRLRNNR